MSLFDIDLYMQHGDMFCTNCSSTVKNCVQKFLQEKNLSFNYISTNFKEDIVNIVELDITQQEVSTLIENIKDKLSRIGYDCINFKIVYSLEGEQESPESISNNKTDPCYDYVKVSIALTTGMSLMLAEHLEYFPLAESSEGKAVNITVGFFSTVLSGWLGANHFINSWKKKNAMDTLIAFGISTSLVYSFLLITVPSLEAQKSSTFFNLPLMILGFLKLSHILRNRLQENIEAQILQVETHKKTLPRTVNAYLLDETKEESFINILHQPIPDLSLFDAQLEKATHVNTLKKGTIICVEHDAIVPIDSIILEKNTISVREDFYGERGEKVKSPGEQIYAGTVNVSGHTILLKTTVEAKDNHLKRAYDNLKKESEPDYLIEMVSSYFLLIVVASASISAIFWAIFGPKPSTRYFPQVLFSMFLSACPCSFGLLGINESVVKALAFKKGILIQNANIFTVDQATLMCVDKTGTLTKEVLAVADIIGKNGEHLSLSTYLPYAALLQQQIPSENQSAVSEAFLKKAKTEKIDFTSLTCTGFIDNPFNKGRGGKAIINGMNIVVGNKQLITHHQINIDNKWLRLEAAYAQRDMQAIFLAIGQEVKGLFILKPVNELEQQLRPNVANVLAGFIAKGITIHMLTGDSPERAHTIKDHLVSQNLLCKDIIIRGNLTPQDKEEYIKEKRKENKQVVMLGDGYNDSQALRAANWGLAIDNLAPIAHQADAVLNGSLVNLAQLMSLAKTYRESYYTSLSIAFGFNGISMVVSSGIFYPFTKKLLDPMISGMIMIGSSLILVFAITLFQQIGKIRQKNIEEQFNSSYKTNWVKKETTSCWPFWLRMQKPHARAPRASVEGLETRLLGMV